MNTPSVRPPPIRGRALSTVLLAWLLLATGCGSHTDLAEHVALRLTTQEIEPGSRFEVVFDDPVVRLDHLGSPAENPLQIDPPLAGTFAWRSRRSGIFNPSEPMHLGTRYQFTLRPGLRDATGQPLRARLRRSFQTPGLTATLRHDGWWDESDAPALPGVIVTLNARVDAKDFQDLALFTDDHTGMGVTAEPLSWQPDASSPGMETRFPTWQDVPTWEERFPGASNLPPHAPGPPGRASAFLIRPQAPLASTNVWRLEIWALGSEETRLSLGTVSNIIGRAVPFIVQSAEAANTVHGGRQLRLHFSRRVAPGLATNDPASWLVCEPAVTNLTVERSAGGRTLAVSGAFRLGQDYRISVNRNLPGEEPVTLTRPFNQQFRFEPIRPSVWLAEFNTVQLATGRRQMEMLAVNTPETRLRIKALDRHGLIPTLRAYERYLRSGSPYTPDTVPGAALDYAGIPGRTVYDNHLASAGPRDETVPLVRSWDDLGALGIHGAFFLEADLHQVPVEAGGTGTRVGPQAIVQLTDLGLVTKTGALDTTVWVFSHTSAKPLAGVTVNLRSEEDEILAEAVTDNDGLVHLPASERAKWVLAERAGDLHAERLGDGEIPMWGFQLPGTGRESADLRLFAFSDREAYRPGETLHLKILARTWSEIGWQFPTNPSVKLQLSGPRGDVTLRTNLILSASGSTEWMWTAPVGVRGTFQARLECGDAQANHAFEVRDFQPAAFEVTLGAKPVYGPDDVLTIPVQARYLFGQPLAHAKVLWSADASDQTFAPEGWKTFRFGLALGDWRLIEAQAPAGEAARHGTGELNAGAPLMLAPELPFNPVFPQPQAVRFLAEVTDLNQQTLAQSAEFVRHPSDFYLGFRWTRGEEALLVTNVPLAFQLVAVRTDGTPWPAPVEVQAKLRRVEWKAVRILRAGRVIGHRSEPEYHDVVERTVRTQTAARIGERWQAADDSGRSLPSWEAGPWGSMAGRKTRPPRAIATAPGGRVFLPAFPWCPDAPWSRGTTSRRAAICPTSPNRNTTVIAPG